MFLSSSAGRFRRDATLGLLLLLLSVLSFWPIPAFSKISRYLVRPVAELVRFGLKPLEAFSYLSSSDQEFFIDRGISASLIDTERDLGTPKAVNGIAWLEVPVWEFDSHLGLLYLAAGEDFALARGQAVVFGSSWVGRISSVDSQRATVNLWMSTGARTGVYLANKKNRISAVAMGRGAMETPLVRWLNPEGMPEAGDIVYWRPFEDENPSLEKLAFRLGALMRQGDELKGLGVWTVQPEFPIGAEGRVWVAAGAVGDSLVAAPSLEVAPVVELLRGDGVLVGPWFFAKQSIATPARVVEAQGRLWGEVSRQSGSGIWFLRRNPDDWIGQSVALNSENLFDESGDILFSRGGSGIPRGFFLGRTGEVASNTLPDDLRSLAQVESNR